MGNRARGRRRAVAGVVLLSGLVAGAVGTGTMTGTVSAAPTGCAPNDRFGFMMQGLPAAQHDPTRLTRLANEVTEKTHIEPNDESDIDAGYTYVGQFIDHDITLDPRPDDLLSIIDGTKLKNSRTPSLDLDSVYGNGPAGSPQLYESNGYLLKLGAPQTGSQSDPGARDVLRDARGRAVLGDDRNDENKIVASLHSIVTRFHNKVALDIKIANPSWSNTKVFEEARQQVRWHYQWAILTDFLPTMSSSSEVGKVVRWNGSSWVPSLKYYDPCKGSMPLEFSTAAYRWHTMVRDDYQINDAVKDLPVFDGSFNPRSNLAGFQPSPSDFGFDWDYFFSGGDEEAQKAYKLDNSLVPGLGILPGGAAGAGPVNLSERNLLRGRQLGMPSGQTLARAFGITPLRDDQILIGPALGRGAPTKSITSISSNFKGNAPLWAYLFAESVNAKYLVIGGKIWFGSTPSLRLGPVGARIVNETFVGLMNADAGSIIHNTSFRPNPKYVGKSGEFGFRQIIAVGTGPVPNVPTDPQPPTGPKQACPAAAAWNAGYYNNAELTGDPARCRSEGSINLNWGTNRPSSTTGIDNWSLRIDRNLTLAAGTRTFTVTADDGVRVYVDGVKIIDSWTTSPVRTLTGTATVTAGSHNVMVEYKDVSGSAQLNLVVS